MKIPFKILHPIFIFIALFSVLSCFPKIFISFNQYDAPNEASLKLYQYINVVGQLKLDFKIFFNIFGIFNFNSDVIKNLPTIALAFTFIIAAILFYKNKTKGLIRILKIGAMLVVTNALLSAIILLATAFLGFSNIVESADIKQIIIPFVLFIGLVFLGHNYFTQLNEIKDNQENKLHELQLENSVFDDLITKNSAIYDEATFGQRAGNYVIDLIFMFGAIAGFGFVLFAVFGNKDEAANPSRYYFYFGAIFANIFYYTFLEKLFGVTIGKLVTNTRVVQENGSNITWAQSFIRTISRCVPFEWLSTFTGYPWHDKWSNTYVVKEDKAFLENTSNYENAETVKMNIE